MGGMRMQRELLSCIEKSPGHLECTLDLSGLYPSRDEFVKFKNRYDKFLNSDRETRAMYKLRDKKLIYQSEQIIPSKRDTRPHLLLVFGNPASHSVKAGCFFAFKDGKENPFWKSLLSHAGILDIGPENEIGDAGANRCRLNKVLTGDYRSPFGLGLCVFFSMPSRAGGDWSGVAGIRRLLGNKAWGRVGEVERDRVINIARKFIKGDGVVVTFQRDAWEGLRSKKDPPYAVIKAREGKLKGSMHGMEGIHLMGVPPTRLLGPSREILRRTLSECGYELLPVSN
jgi:hypothetical protein